MPKLDINEKSQSSFSMLLFLYFHRKVKEH